MLRNMDCFELPNGCIWPDVDELSHLVTFAPVQIISVGYG